MNPPRQPDFAFIDRTEPAITERGVWLWTVALGLLTAALGVWVVGDFSRPLSDGTDTDQYEYVSYFFAKNLSLGLWPHLNLDNNQSFYPYGLNQVFLDWGFERDYWYALCYWLFDGPGPYLQYYYVYSLVVAAVGTFVLLHGRFGVGKSLAAGLIVSVFNFYALYKFPVHLNVSVVHWTTLSIVATYRLLFDVVQKKPVSGAFVLAWMWLHVQVLGQELGYVAGFALTFTTLTLPVLAVIGFSSLSGLKPNAARRDWIARRNRRAWLFLALLLLSLWLYLPLTVQIALTAWQFDFDTLPVLRAWSHPARLLIPYLPRFDTFAVPAYQRWFGDQFESYGQGSPGLYLVILAGVGLWQQRRRVALWLPIVLMLALCLTYHPLHFPTLKVFPWFSFNRHGGRASLVYPLLFTLLALPVRVPTSRARLGRGWAADPAYAGRVDARLSGAYVHPGTRGVGLGVTLLRGRPAAARRGRARLAVLHRGGRRRGRAGRAVPLLPAAKRGFHVSAVLRQKSRRTIFRAAPPRSDSAVSARRLAPAADTRPGVYRSRLAVSGSVLRKNHFAGINLYPDLLTPDQVRRFYRRYGPPLAETRFPAAGRVVFLPLAKPSKSKRQVTPDCNAPALKSVQVDS